MHRKTDNRATKWRLKSRTLEFGRLPLLMGIINVTPDSFSDGGHFLGTDAAVAHGLRLAEEGAAILDVGGESTRPYSTPVAAAEELRRVLPVVEQLCAQTNVPVSIDTSKSTVAREAIAVGAEIVNDVTGLESDPQMLDVVCQSDVGVCAMHMQGSPQTMQDEPTYENVVEEIHAYLAARRDSLVAAGISADHICLDPGIGFGKTHEHNLTLIANCHRFHDLGCPLLVGHSRKGFIGKLIGDKNADRTAGTLGVSLALVQRQVQILRVHDVLATKHAFTLFDAGGGNGESG